VKRINISYGGEHYTMANADPEVVKADITKALAGGQPLWLRANHGEGTVRAADLLITTGTPIALMGIDPTTSIDGEDSTAVLSTSTSPAADAAHDAHDAADALGAE
jgi:hypothetical protein